MARATKPKHPAPSAHPAAGPAAKRPPAAKPKGHATGKGAAPRHAAPAKPKTGAAPAEPAPAVVPLASSRRHLLSLSFLRDGDEFLARLEMDSGQITEMKNRSLDQLLTLVAGELEDLLE